ncbi:MAG: response regulator [Nitrospirae bacterium]|nr:response regulator [Nitrospirota bacterium]
MFIFEVYFAVLGNYNILIVDDCDLLCLGLKRMISAPNLNISVVKNGNDALSALRSSNFHSVFLDVNLPDINGIEVLKELKRMSPHTKVVVMTANTTEDYRQKALEGGAFHFIGKPFEAGEIHSVIQNILS